MADGIERAAYCVLVRERALAYENQFCPFAAEFFHIGPPGNVVHQERALFGDDETLRPVYPLRERFQNLQEFPMVQCAIAVVAEIPERDSVGLMRRCCSAPLQPEQGARIHRAP